MVASGPKEPINEFLRPAPSLNLLTTPGTHSTPLPGIPQIPLYQSNFQFPTMQGNFQQKPGNPQNLLSLLLRS